MLAEASSVTLELPHDLRLERIALEEEIRIVQKTLDKGDFPQTQRLFADNANLLVKFSNAVKEGASRAGYDTSSYGYVAARTFAYMTEALLAQGGSQQQRIRVNHFPLNSMFSALEGEIAHACYMMFMCDTESAVSVYRDSAFPHIKPGSFDSNGYYFAAKRIAATSSEAGLLQPAAR